MSSRMLILWCLLAMTGTAFSQPPGKTDARLGKMPMMPGAMGIGHQGMATPSDMPPQMMLNFTELQKLMSDINIKSDVAAKIITITRAFQGILDDRIMKIQREELNIKEELLKNKPELSKIQTMIAKKTQIFGEIEFAQIKRDLDIKALLTQDEYDRWKNAMMQRMRDMMPPLFDKPGANQPGSDAPKK